MKKLLLLSIFLILTYSAFAQSEQTNEANSKFKLGLIITPKVGSAKLRETGNAPLTVNINSLDVLISMRPEGWPFFFQTGLVFLEFDRNRSLNGNTSSLQNNYLQIPVKYGFDLNILENKSKSQKLYATIGAGLYASALASQITETITTTTNDTRWSWNFGALVQFGAEFNATKKINLRMGYESQTDLSKAKENGIESSMHNFNALYFGFEFKLK